MADGATLTELIMVELESFTQEELAHIYMCLRAGHHGLVRDTLMNPQYALALAKSQRLCVKVLRIYEAEMKKAVAQDGE